jgi:hypothetical protein
VPDAHWKQRERSAAALFGCKRQMGSGSCGRADLQSRSDSTHPSLFLETKTHARHAARSLYDATKLLAQRERKVPILLLATKGRPGFLVCAHSDDLAAVCAEYAAAHMQEMEPLIRQAWLRSQGAEGPADDLPGPGEGE